MGVTAQNLTLQGDKILCDTKQGATTQGDETRNFTTQDVTKQTVTTQDVTTQGDKHRCHKRRYHNTGCQTKDVIRNGITPQGVTK